MRVEVVSYLPRLIKPVFPGMWLMSLDVEWAKGPAVKVVVVRTPHALKRVWNKLTRLRDGHNPEPIGSDCLGFCHQCWGVAEKDGKRRMVVDGRYAAVVVLLAPKATWEVVCHESFHAGLAVARRRLRNPEPNFNEMEEEETAAYPAGQIAHRIMEQFSFIK